MAMPEQPSPPVQNAARLPTPDGPSSLDPKSQSYNIKDIPNIKDVPLDLELDAISFPSGPSQNGSSSVEFRSRVPDKRTSKQMSAEVRRKPVGSTQGSRGPVPQQQRSTDRLYDYKAPDVRYKSSNGSIPRQVPQVPQVPQVQAQAPKKKGFFFRKKKNDESAASAAAAAAIAASSR